MYALDTNSVIYLFKGMGQVAERLLAVAPGDVAIPAIVHYEIEVGLAKSAAPEKRRRQFQEILRWVPILPFDDRVAPVAARIRAELESRGEPIGPLDTLIAGTALTHGAILVTRNTREFGRIPGLRLEDWYGPS
jgi:tRNA(fMet)-specific endonuclease VapC